LEVGFQSYPTAFEDSGLAKVKLIKEAFNKRIVFADHLDGNSPEALQLPVYAMLQGASIIEKHVMHSERETKYDGFSSITVEKFKHIILNQKVIENAYTQPFLNEREIAYLVKSNQIPLTASRMEKGTRLTNDILTFKRTSQKGITYSDLKGKLNGRYYLTEAKEVEKTFTETDFYAPKVATIIAVRLKSSRLKEKAKLKIGNLSSVELCLKHALRFTVSDYTILATSTTEQDAELKNFTYSKDVIFHQGDPEDVITRYLSIAEKLNIDIIIRITGDNAFVCKDLADFLMQSHMRKGADYTTGIDAPIGANLEIMNVKALRKIKEYFKNADYSEYMTWYFTNNPEHFNLNFVELPNEWRGNYRLTLDYEVDLEMYNRIMKHYTETHSEFSLASIVAYLKANPEIATMNAQIGLKFKTDQALIDTLNKATKMT
jgi:spore coat polysaccharide biosynthesis protein SpsF (cytidylyltransferase family)